MERIQGYTRKNNICKFINFINYSKNLKYKCKTMTTSNVMNLLKKKHHYTRF